MVSNEHDLAYHKEAYEHILKENANRTSMRMSMIKRSESETMFRAAKVSICTQKAEWKAETQTTIRALNNCAVKHLNKVWSRNFDFGNFVENNMVKWAEESMTKPPTFFASSSKFWPSRSILCSSDIWTRNSDSKLTYQSVFAKHYSKDWEIENVGIIFLSNI